MLSLALGFFISLLITLLIVRYAHLHADLSADRDLNGVQKFHAQPVPRIGGVGIFLGLVLASLQLYFTRYTHVANGLLILAACGLPAFSSGLVEDMTKRVTPAVRLLATMLSALLCWWLMGVRITHVDMAWLDPWFGMAVIGVPLTIIAVSGLANAINIIDGFNGLASMVALMMFVSLAYVAFQVGDPVVLSGSLIMMGAILGFFLWNYPAGLIFLGDGGAYFLGFVLGELAILLVMRNPTVSPWYPVLLAMYPIFEVCFSIYRKRFVRGISPGIPDGVHLHMLVYKRLMRWVVGSKTAREMTQRNSLTSPYLWLLCLLAVIPATLFWRSTGVLFAFVALFALVYVWLYVSIVRFKAPKWLIFRKGKASGQA